MAFQRHHHPRQGMIGRDNADLKSGLRHKRRGLRTDRTPPVVQPHRKRLPRRGCRPLANSTAPAESAFNCWPAFTPQSCGGATTVTAEPRMRREPLAEALGERRLGVGRLHHQDPAISATPAVGRAGRVSHQQWRQQGRGRQRTRRVDQPPTALPGRAQLRFPPHAKCWLSRFR